MSLAVLTCMLLPPLYPTADRALFVDLFRYPQGGDLVRGPQIDLCKEASCLHNLFERCSAFVLHHLSHRRA